MEVPDDGAPAMLQDYRYVYLNSPRHDTTASHVALRKFLKSDFKGFMAQLAAMEKEHRAWKREKGKDDAVEADPGTRKCLDLAERLIKVLADGANGITIDMEIK